MANTERSSGSSVTVEKAPHYEYNRVTDNILIRGMTDQGYTDYEFIRKGNENWKILYHSDAPGEFDALWIGQGCWHELVTVSEEEADEILRSWGYDEDSKAREWLRNHTSNIASVHRLADEAIKAELSKKTSLSDLYHKRAWLLDFTPSKDVMGKAYASEGHEYAAMCNNTIMGTFRDTYGPFCIKDKMYELSVECDVKKTILKIIEIFENSRDVNGQKPDVFILICSQEQAENFIKDEEVERYCEEKNVHVLLGSWKTHFDCYDKAFYRLETKYCNPFADDLDSVDRIVF